MDAQQIRDLRRLNCRRWDEKVRRRTPLLTRLAEERRAKVAVIDQEFEMDRIDDAAAAAWGQSVLTTFERETAIILGQCKLE